MAKGAKRTVRYFTLDDDVGVTPSRLKRMSAKRQMEYLLHWFGMYYEDPAHQTSYNTREGGYLWNHGGPYDAAEELYSEFEGIVSEDVIQQAADAVQDENGIYDWAATSAHPDMRDAYDEAMSEAFDEDRPAPRSPDDTLAEVQRLLVNGTLPTYGTADELAQRRDILERLAVVEAELAKLKPVHGGIGHNNPPPDELDDEEGVLEQSRDATTTIQAELGKQQPDAAKVAESASVLSRAAKFLAKKAAEKGLEEVAKRVWESPIAQGAIAAAGAAIYAAYDKIVDWLFSITLPF